jgi:hypothetical protein
VKGHSNRENADETADLAVGPDEHPRFGFGVSPGMIEKQFAKIGFEGSRRRPAPVSECFLKYARDRVYVGDGTGSDVVHGRLVSGIFLKVINILHWSNVRSRHYRLLVLTSFYERYSIGAPAVGNGVW